MTLFITTCIEKQCTRSLTYELRVFIGLLDLWKRVTWVPRWGRCLVQFFTVWFEIYRDVHALLFVMT